MNKINSVLRIVFLSTISVLLLLAFSCDQMLTSMSIALSASQGDYEDRIFLSWNAPSYPDYDKDGYPDAYVINYTVYQNSSILATTSSTSYSDTFASPDVEYSYYVRANFDNLDTIPSGTVTGFAIRKKNAHLYSSDIKAAADPVITSTGISQSTWHQVYLQKNWTYHFIAQDYSGSTPMFTFLTVYKQNEITSFIDDIYASLGGSIRENIFTCPSSGYYWIKVRANAAFQFYAWYE